MYDKKYRVTKIEEFGKHNYIYDGVEGNICYLAYLKVGERGWFLHESYMYDLLDWAPVHRIHTSEIESVDYKEDGSVIVITQNTRFVFEICNEVIEDDWI